MAVSQKPKKKILKILWKLLNVIAIGQRETKNINRMITISKPPTPKLSLCPK
jgi:hypothetical protein